MLFPTLLTLAALSTSAIAAPAASKNPTDFLLVTTTSCEPAKNSSLLPSVSATSLFDPFSQPTYLLRTISPGYGSLPRFNLTSGTLESLTNGPHGIGEFEYNTTTVRTGEELQFEAAKPAGKGNLSLLKGFLLAVNGKGQGWTICDGDLEQSVIEWKGSDASCVPTFVQAVQNAPY